jgi:transcriptional regulator with XRE-family HTH domain
MSQQDVADQLGTTQNLIYRMENELGSSIFMLLHISLYYRQQHQLNFDWLFNPEPEESEFAPMLTSADLSLRKQIALADRLLIRFAKEIIRDVHKFEESL